MRGIGPAQQRLNRFLFSAEYLPHHQFMIPPARKPTFFFGIRLSMLRLAVLFQIAALCMAPMVRYGPHTHRTQILVLGNSVGPETGRLVHLAVAATIIITTLIELRYGLRFVTTRINNRRRTNRANRGLCAHCGYDLRGGTGVCPECGTPAAV